MRKVYITESSLERIRKDGKLLPQFLFKAVKEHKTSLGDSKAFPTNTDFPYDYKILKERYNEVCEKAEELGIDSVEGASNELHRLVTMCKRIETPIRESLERICENAVNRLFAIPKDMISFSCKLTDKIELSGNVRIKPQSDEDLEYEFDDTDDIDSMYDEIEKRRLVDSLVQGASYIYSKAKGAYGDEIDSLDDRLMPLYDRIRELNDYLLFTKEETITDENPSQGSYVEVHLGNDGLRTSIEAQGLIFPLLLQDTIRGLFELFSSHGLPTDVRKAKYIVSKADYLLSEAWDLRFGVIIWKNIFKPLESVKMVPYAFTKLVSIPTSKFFKTVKEILSNTTMGREIIGKIMASCEYDSGYQSFKNRINAKNLSKSVIADSYFTDADLDSLELDSDDNVGDVITEDE